MRQNKSLLFLKRANLIIICLLVCLSVSFLLGNFMKASAAENCEIEVGTYSTAAGEEVEVAIEVKSNPGIMYLAIELEYDESVLTLVDSKTGNIFDDSEITYSQTMTDNPYTIVCIANGMEDINTTGILTTLTFSVSDDAAEGNYTLELRARDNAANLSEETIEVVVNEGSIVIEESTSDSSTEGSKMESVEETDSVSVTESTNSIISAIIAFIVSLFLFG